MGVGAVWFNRPIIGRWPHHPHHHPPEIILLGRRFRRASFIWPFYPHERALAQYREVVAWNAMHLSVHANGTYVVDHLDEANPDQGHPIAHTLIDTPVGVVLFGIGAVAIAVVIGRALR